MILRKKRTKMELGQTVCFSSEDGIECTCCPCWMRMQCEDGPDNGRALYLLLLLDAHAM